MKQLATLLILMVLVSQGAKADNAKLEAAVGAGIGGAVGAAIGDELGDRNGAIVGGAVGAAVGAALATDDDHEHSSPGRASAGQRVAGDAYHAPSKGRHCPPGQAKKGRC